MSSTREPTEGSYYDRSLREHVIDPVASAISHAERERSELEAEREALESFENTVSNLNLRGEGMRPLSDRPTDRSAAIRSAYRETVMDLEHYDREYGEPLLESLANELTPEIAAVLSPDTQQPLTEFHRTVITNAVDESLQRRERIIKRVDQELRSLRESQNDIEGLLNQLNSVRKPDIERVEAELEAISRRRQDVLHRKLPYAMDDEHTFREYLYLDESWTYPVLKAITRFEDVVADDGTDTR